MTVTIEQNIQPRSSNIGIIQIITAHAENQYSSAHNNPGSLQIILYESEWLEFLRKYSLNPGLTLPTGQWYAPSAVIHDAWYCMVFHGIPWYCMILHGPALYCIVWHGIAQYCTVLHGIAW